MKEYKSMWDWKCPTCNLGVEYLGKPLERCQCPNEEKYLVLYWNLYDMVPYKNKFSLNIKDFQDGDWAEKGFELDVWRQYNRD